MKDEEEKTKEPWQKPEICDLDIRKTAGKYYEDSVEDTYFFGAS
jgi:hypothetical protein